jgi:hypothetical protein
MFGAGRLDVEAASLFKLTVLASSPHAYGEVLPERSSRSKFVRRLVGVSFPLSFLRVVRGMVFKSSEEFFEAEITPELPTALM